MNDENGNNLSECVKNDIIVLNMKWVIYKNTFENQKRNELLAEASPIIFSIFQKLLLDDIALTLCRLTDPAKTGKKNNNTMYQLIEKKRLNTSALDEVTNKIKKIRELRNKFLAHSDLTKTLSHFAENTSNGKTVQKLNIPLSINTIDNVINEIGSIYNKATNEHCAFSSIISPHGPDCGVKMLIDHLKSALFNEQLIASNALEASAFYEEWQQFKHKDA
ncbi:hypothetical protein MNBD_UNCLBAC01-2099 [hydrothermal vent metagenome]|uniref:HEPN AbiU2-like domain-containing protein n=1 Tax=hydrothermal vent metagenome TaxID=652676 RepID=A0A3B1CY41_9ZZZZ